MIRYQDKISNNDSEPSVFPNTLSVALVSSVLFVLILAIAVGSGAIFIPFQKEEVWENSPSSLVGIRMTIKGNQYHFHVAGCVGLMVEEQGHFVRIGDQITLYPRNSTGAAHYNSQSMRVIHDQGVDYLIDDHDIRQIMEYEDYGLVRTAFIDANGTKTLIR